MDEGQYGFVIDLPWTQRGFDIVFMVVERFLKMTHFIACKRTYDASYITNLFFNEVVKHHELPWAIVSNWDSKFISHLCRSLWSRLGTSLSFNSAYHPQLDS